MMMTKTQSEIESFRNAIQNAIMELWASGQVGATSIVVANIGWLVSLDAQPRWVVTLHNVDRRNEKELMEGLNILMQQTEWGEEDMDVYTEWADESCA